MNDLELREQFAQWSAPLRAASPPSVRAIRRRVRRRRARVAGAAGAAACVLAGLVTALLSASGSIGSLPPQRRPPVTPGPGPADIFGHGRYPAPKTGPYLVLNYYGRGFLRVIDAADGQVLGRQVAAFTDITPEASGRTFIGLANGFEQISVRAGRVSMKTIMPGVTIPPQYQPYGMSVNPQGTRLAVSVAPDGIIAPSWLYVFNLTTGAVVDKLNEGSSTVSLQYWPSATRLAFSYANNNGPAGNGLRILNTSAAVKAGSSLVAASTLDARLQRFARAQLSADGSAAIEVGQDGSAAVLTEYSVSTGRLLHAVTIGTGGALTQSPNVCGVLWASANGADLLTQCGTRQFEIIDGRATSSRFAAEIPQSAVGWADSFAW
jgi:hypothetical protein